MTFAILEGAIWRIFNLLVDGIFFWNVLNVKHFSIRNNLYRKYLYLGSYVGFGLSVCFITGEWNCFCGVVPFIVTVCYLIYRDGFDRFNFDVILIACILVSLSFCGAVINMLVNSLPWRKFIYTHIGRAVSRYLLQAVLYSFTLWFLNKKKVFSGNYMKSVADHFQAPALFVLYFVFSLYLRYRANNATISEDRDTLNIFYMVYLFLIPIFLMTYWLLAKLSSLKNVIQNGEYDEVFENVAVMPIHSSKINFSPDLYAYEKDKVIFRKKLANLGITNMDCGYSHLVFSLIALSYLPDKEQVNIEKDILERVAEFIHKDSSVLRTEINNIIHKVWTQGDIETLKWGYEYSNNVKHKVPTVDEFLIHMVNKAS